MRTVLGNILQMHHTAQNPVIQKPVQTVEKERQSVQAKDAWERVTISRKNDRPVGQDYIRILFSDFLEFHGDRCYGMILQSLDGNREVCGDSGYSDRTGEGKIYQRKCSASFWNGRLRKDIRKHFSHVKRPRNLNGRFFCL